MISSESAGKVKIEDQLPIYRFYIQKNGFSLKGTVMQII